LYLLLWYKENQKQLYSPCRKGREHACINFRKSKKRAGENASENKLFESIVRNRQAAGIELPFRKIETPKEFFQTPIHEILSAFCRGGMPKEYQRGSFDIQMKPFVCFSC